jgi:hypothetical protein
LPGVTRRFDQRDISQKELQGAQGNGRPAEITRKQLRMVRFKFQRIKTRAFSQVTHGQILQRIPIHLREFQCLPEISSGQPRDQRRCLSKFRMSSLKRIFDVCFGKRLESDVLAPGLDCLQQSPFALRSQEKVRIRWRLFEDFQERILRIHIHPVGVKNHEYLPRGLERHAGCLVCQNPDLPDEYVACTRQENGNIGVGRLLGKHCQQLFIDDFINGPFFTVFDQPTTTRLPGKRRDGMEVRVLQSQGKPTLRTSAARSCLRVLVKFLAQQRGREIQSNRILADTGWSREEIGMCDTPILNRPAQIQTDNLLSHNPREKWSRYRCASH